jgi:hypothetical protein
LSIYSTISVGNPHSGGGTIHIGETCFVIED